MLNARFIRHVTVGVALTALVVQSAQPGAAQTTTYMIIDLGTLGGDASFGNAVNASGQVAGEAQVPGRHFHAFRWPGPATGATQDLGTLGGDTSAGFGINTAGRVTGYSQISPGPNAPSHAFTWPDPTTGGMQDLGTLAGGSVSVGIGINTNGQVVGSSNAADGFDHAFLWTAPGPMQDLGTLPGYTGSEATSINDAGQLVGYGETTCPVGVEGPCTPRAFLWVSPGPMQDLGALPGGSNSVALGINSGGTVVGEADTGPAPSPFHAFRWTSPGPMQDLGTLPGGSCSEALGIDTAGNVVGQSEVAPGLALCEGTFHASLWTASSGMTDLNTRIDPSCGWVLTTAAGINDTGQIVGSGVVNGQSHAFLMTSASVARPTVGVISPNSGSGAGGTVVTICGGGFSTTPGATSVNFGPNPATNVSCASAATCTATSPAGTGTVDVTVTVGGQTSATSPADQFTYVPAVSGINPNSGPEAGGTVVTITGGGFSTTPGATSVNFGPNPATNVSCASATTCTATSPAGTGTVDVTVTVGSQTSATSPADQFTYIAPPTVSGIGPNSGPAAGGTVVTITGSGFSTTPGATSVNFGPNPATNVSCASATTCTATSPAGTGTVDVTVTVGGQTSATSPAGQFTYTAAPLRPARPTVVPGRP